MNLENKYQLIDEYLNRTMIQDDIDKFKAFMQSDADLKADIKIVEEMNEMAEFSAPEQDLRDTLTSIRKGDIVKPKSRTKYFVWLAAACFLAGLCYFAYPYIEQGTDQQYLHQYASVEPLALTTKSADSNEDIRLMQAYYNQGEYKKALVPINTYLKSHESDIDVLLAKGISHYKTDDFVAAQETFKIIAALGPRVAKHKWHSAMAYLKAGDKTQAILVFKEIVSDKSYNHELAKELLSKY